LIDGISWCSGVKDDLLDPVDRLLEDPDPVELVRQYLARHPASTRAGRIRSLPCFPEIVLRLRGILERFLNAVSCMDACFVSDDNLENLSQPAQVGQIKVGGIDLHKPRMRGLPSRSWHCPLAPKGFTASDVAENVRTMSREPDSEYGACRAAHDIKKLRGNGIVRKIGGSRRYEPLPEGLRAVIALVVLRETVIRPLLAASTRPETQSKLSNPPPIDQHYEKPQSRHAQPLYGTWCGRLGIHSLFFIPSDKGQTGARIVIGFIT
jgi:hypothetical protein